MKHLAKIQSEFLKQARSWDRLSLDDQKTYLKRHPKSKKRLTGKLKSKKITKSDLNNKVNKLNAEANRREKGLLYAKKELIQNKEKEKELQKELKKKQSKGLNTRSIEKQLETIKNDLVDINDDIEMYKKDAKDLRKVQEYIKAGKLKGAMRKLDSMDTEVRDNVSASVWNFLNAQLGYN